LLESLALSKPLTFNVPLLLLLPEVTATLFKTDGDCYIRFLRFIKSLLFGVKDSSLV
jgi:hypothetical protein